MFLNVSFSEIIFAIIQIAINLNEWNQLCWHAVKFKYICIIDGPVFRRRISDVDWIAIQISIRFTISKRFYLSTGNDVLEHKLRYGSFVKICSVKVDFRYDYGEWSIWG